MGEEGAYASKFSQAVLGAPAFEGSGCAGAGQHALVQQLDQGGGRDALLSGRCLQRRGGTGIGGGQAGDRRSGQQGRGLPAAETIVAVGRAHAASQRKQAPMVPVQACPRRAGGVRHGGHSSAW